VVAAVAVAPSPLWRLGREVIPLGAGARAVDVAAAGPLLAGGFSAERFLGLFIRTIIGGGPRLLLLTRTVVVGRAERSASRTVDQTASLVASACDSQRAHSVARTSQRTQ